MTPKEAYVIAKKEGPSDLTRNAVLKDPWYAHWYAKYIDKCPRDDTRNAVLKVPKYAYRYAEDVDKCPRDDTRQVVLSDPWYAHWYSKYIDKCWRVDTWIVARGTKSNRPFEYSLKWLVLGDIPDTLVIL